jgi:hypothetical protein
MNEDLPKVALTKRGYSLAESIHQGLLNRQIADKLGLSEGSVKVQLNRMLYALLPSTEGSSRVQIALMFERGQFYVRDKSPLRTAAIQHPERTAKEDRWNAIFEKKFGREAEEYYAGLRMR